MVFCNLQIWNATICMEYWIVMYSESVKIISFVHSCTAVFMTYFLVEVVMWLFCKVSVVWKQHIYPPPVRNWTIYTTFVCCQEGKPGINHTVHSCIRPSCHILSCPKLCDILWEMSYQTQHLGPKPKRTKSHFGTRALL